MPYDRRHVYIQWGGTLPGGEIWSNSLRGASSETGPTASVPTHAEMAEWLAGELKDEISAFHARATTKVHTVCKLTYAKANVVDMDGRYVEKTTHEYVYPTPVAGSSSTALHPSQICWCVSLTTGLSRGPAHRGRFYLPMPAVSPQSTDGLVGAADAAGLAGSAKTFIEAVADTPGIDLGIPFKVLVMSKKAGAAATHEVTGIEVGRVLDTQQRRRRSLGEAYELAVVDQGAA